MTIGIKSLSRFFRENSNTDNCSYKGKCHRCGCDLEVKITKTSGGYGLNGGALCELKPRGICALCDDCYLKSGGSETTAKGPFTNAA